MADIRKIAHERIVYLFAMAKKSFSEGREDLAKRYVHLAREVAMKSQVTIPRDLKRSFCKECGAYWVPGKSLRTRLQKKDKRVSFTCIRCGYVRRVPYSKRR